MNDTNSILILAPMQGLVDDVMRNLLTQIGGFDECVSEFVRITHTVHSRATWLKHAPEMATRNRTPAGVPCTVQILGSDAENMAENAVNAARFGAEKIDLNFGCPAPTVNKHQGGAVLLKEPERIYQIVRTIRNRLPEHIPLTAKMRLGYENTDLALENAQAMENGGACGLTVHARTKVEGYEPPAHWEWIRHIADVVSIPVTANGDVFTLQDYQAIRQQTGCDRIMLGRGTVMRPDLARQIRRFERFQAADAATASELADWIIRFYRLCCEKTASPNYPLARLKQWLSMLKQGYPETEPLYTAIRPIRETEQAAAILEQWQQQSA